MALQAGTSIGPFEIVAPLGAGGMGEVYRARDPRLDRDVALKMLPDAFANDVERAARFEREAKTLASLNHPNIAGVHGLERANDVHVLVMELVEGEDLSARIARGPIPADEALPIARQIAEALEAAHEQGIVHRDLKPANIKLRPDGTIKVLDFGLAKAFEPTGSSPAATQSPTLSIHATQAGVILGTAAYMSPEQARGRPVDRRADIWAFGVVLYEMLSGHRAFEGETISDVLAFVITKDPDWTALPAGIANGVSGLLRRCLTKDPRQRLRDIGEARIAIDAAGTASPETTMPSAAPRYDARWLRLMPWAVAILSIAAAVAAWRMTPAPSHGPIKRFAVQLPPTLDRTIGLGTGVGLAISPDGQTIAYADAAGMLERRLDSLAVEPVRGAETGRAPFFSPDGEWIGFFTSNDLRKVPVGGGTSVRICDVPLGRGAAWADDNTIAFTSAGGLFLVPASG